jgi:hypothetical protein
MLLHLQQSRTLLFSLLFFVAWVFFLWEGRAWAEEGVSFALATMPSKARFQLFDQKGVLVQEGETPFVGTLKAGIYRLRLSHDGYYEESRSLRVQPHKPVILQVELLSHQGLMAIPRKLPPASQPSTTPLPPRTQAIAPRPALPPPTSQAVEAQKKEPVGGVGAEGKKEGAAEVGVGKIERGGQEPQGPPPTSYPPALESKPSKKVASTQPASSKVVENTKAPARSIPWIPLAIAAACGIAGGIFFGLSQASLDASKNRNTFQVDAYSEHLQAQSHRTTAFSLFIAGGASLAIAGLMYWGVLKSRSGAQRSPRADRYAPITSNQPPTPARRLLSLDVAGSPLP